MTTTLAELEATGPTFSVDALMAVRARTRWAVHAIASQVEVGMAEEEAKAMARATLSSLGMRRGWHHIIVRLGSNTTKDFMERSEPGVILAPDDIFFVDIGPIYRECEGDAGDTFVVGDDPDHHRAKRDVRTIWEEVRGHWFEHRVSGEELYDFADKTATDLGWKLNFDLSGHRLSEYPHSAHYDGSIADVPYELHPDRWVLEIAIAHPERPFGAFYEDLLLEDQSFPGWVFEADTPPDPEG
ncbi:MAG: M24 family metallopeptidase [Acidimicrobiales bacterium]|jgi:Xaa-Pro aminopeptidase